MRRIGNPDLALRLGYGQVEDIHCPAGTSASGDAQGNVWCQDAAGNKVAATFTPAADQGAITSAPSTGLGVIGWGFVLAGAMLLGAVVMKPSKGRR